jgi:hypothetical protein
MPQYYKKSTKDRTSLCTEDANTLCFEKERPPCKEGKFRRKVVNSKNGSQWHCVNEDRRRTVTKRYKPSSRVFFNPETFQRLSGQTQTARERFEATARRRQNLRYQQNQDQTRGV